MLIQFSVENFRSFKEESILSMVASSIKESTQNVFKISNLSLLKSAVIFGANASGKTNLIRAMKFMKDFTRSSSKDSQVAEKIKVFPFRLNSETRDKPASFEIIFIYDKIRYRYGFSLNEEKIITEWLFYVPNKKEMRVFTRENQKFDLSRHFKSEQALVDQNRIRPNALLLSVSAQFNGAMASKIMEGFNQFNVISAIYSQEYEWFTLRCLKDNRKRKAILNFLKNADMGIEDVNVIERKVNFESLPAEIKQHFKEKKESLTRVDVRTSHKVFDKTGKPKGVVEFDMGNEESDGTQKFFGLSGPILDALLGGKTLVIDELDARLHPRLLRAICDVFNSKEKNPKNAQLIFAAHNTDLLKSNLFRRDQVWFTEKNRYGATGLYSLVEYKEDGGKKVRNDASYEKDYLKGRYGAVPVLREFEVPYGK